MRPLRFTFVVVRYGDGILGGAEVHCRAIVERLARRGHDVRVMTTTATSYKSWRNALPAGEDRVAGVPVTRFETLVPRLFPLDELGKGVCTRMVHGEGGLARLAASDRWGPARRALDEALSRKWIEAQGPWCPSLVRALPAATRDRDAVVFFGYLYYPTIFGLPTVRHKGLMAPLGDEEPMLYAPFVRASLRRPRALIMNVDEEAERVRKIVAPSPVPMGVVALGIDPPPPRANGPRTVEGPYLLLLGRAGKTKPMAPVWRAFVERSDLGEVELDDGRKVDARAVTLVTAGEISPHLEGLPRVVQLGRVADETRWRLVHDSLALVSSSPSESLSLVVLEAWLADKSVVVNRVCDATEGHVRRSAGGVAIDFTRENAGARALYDAIASRATRHERAAKGRAYVERRYAWDAVLDAYETLTTAIADEKDVGEAFRAWGARTGAWTT